MMGLQKSGVTYDYLEEFVLEYGAVSAEQILRLYEVMGVAPKTANQHLKVFKNFITRCRYDRNTNIFTPTATAGTMRYLHLLRMKWSFACGWLSNL